MNHNIKAVVFDVDGTLYNQNKLRVHIVAVILKALLKSPVKSYKDLKLVSEYRKNHEILRLTPDVINKYETQIQRTAEKFNLSRDDAFKIIYDWIHIKPLPFIKRTQRNGLLDLLNWLKSKNIKTGLLSDYPCENKAEVLGIKNLVDLIKSSTDEDIDVFKPESKGILKMAELLNVNPKEMIYVGDRYKIDIMGAEKANVIPVLINSKKYGNKYTIRELSEIKEIVEEINGK
ncbi:MAG TPA: HAD family hydrolase [Ignavibacteria bacterium]|nr:HAD family hydrolase [Ignavibacteria bacterium]